MESEVVRRFSEKRCKSQQRAGKANIGTEQKLEVGGWRMFNGLELTVEAASHADREEDEDKVARGIGEDSEEHFSFLVPIQITPPSLM
eukprot:1069617-Rhodomonas_salina.1